MSFHHLITPHLAMYVRCSPRHHMAANGSQGHTKGPRVTQVIKEGGEITPSVISDYTLSDFLFSVEDSSCTVRTCEGCA